ncbi:Methylthioribose-1-phosphate isomerase [hydrothermal vent metagenome]|uniref:Methylthioribose-1-phosphate isomerase n=1 Tax=hydrothermal vent metagenome TaxID=652676 RepID=A0A3B1BKG0_9ZZZZ
MNKMNSVFPIRWHENRLKLLDQRLLPTEVTEISYDAVAAVADAIRDMVVRGAPAIGITAAFGVVIAARQRYAESPDNWRESISEDLRLLADARPTAINLFWAIERMRGCFAGIKGDPVAPLLAEAKNIHEEDIAANMRMGELGAGLIDAGSNILTHCNAGALATGGYGTALGVIRSAVMAGKVNQVFADETRPWLQGARLTAWELLQDGIPVSLIAEGAASWLMHQGKVQWIVVGSDRIAANGDVANKIGTYQLAVSARYHGVKFMVAAPTSTVDMNVAEGADIPIETRNADELLKCGDKNVAAAGATAWNPVFDVTPAALVDAIVTEQGVVEKPNAEKMLAMMKNA